MVADVEAVSLSSGPDESKVMTLGMPTPAAKRAQARHLVDESERGPEDVLPASMKALQAAASKQKKRASGGWNVAAGGMSALVVATTHRRDVKAAFLEAASRAGYGLHRAGVCKETADRARGTRQGGNP